MTSEASTHPGDTRALPHLVPVGPIRRRCRRVARLQLCPVPFRSSGAAQPSSDRTDRRHGNERRASDGHDSGCRQWAQGTSRRSRFNRGSRSGPPREEQRRLATGGLRSGPRGGASVAQGDPEHRHRSGHWPAWSSIRFDDRVSERGMLIHRFPGLAECTYRAFRSSLAAVKLAHLTFAGNPVTHRERRGGFRSRCPSGGEGWGCDWVVLVWFECVLQSVLRVPPQPGCRPDWVAKQKSDGIGPNVDRAPSPLRSDSHLLELVAKPSNLTLGFPHPFPSSGAARPSDASTR